MFCGFKIAITDKVIYAKLHINNNLNWTYEHDNQGVILPWSKAKFKNITFSTHETGYIEITGSLHKFWNDGLHNYNDYRISDLNDTITSLYQTFDISPYTARLSNLEYGLNVHTPFNANKFIKNLICYRFKNFNLWDNNVLFGKYCEFDQYTIKVYNKSKQFYQPKEILRIEKSIKKMEVLVKGPLYLIDLLKPEIQTKCFKQIIDVFNNILFNETIDYGILSNPELKTYRLVTVEAERWTLFNESKKVSQNAKKRSETKSKYIDIIKSHGKQKYRENIVNLLTEKFNSTMKNGNVLTGNLNEKKECSDTFNT